MASQQSEGWDTPVHAALLGLAIGDALGVPVEFSSREERRARPVADLEGYGTHNQPPGTWSDDASLALCLADALADGYSLQAIADRSLRGTGTATGARTAKCSTLASPRGWPSDD